ncbi:MAG: alpha/beta fold hydrolase [Lawsonella clevelandensis]
MIHGIEAMTCLIQQRHPGVPLIIIGHSWGSFLAQQYCLRANGTVQGLVLTGTSFFPIEAPPDFFDFNRKWRNNPDCESNEWLTRDPDVRKAARDDPYMVDILQNFMYERPEEALTFHPLPQPHRLPLLSTHSEWGGSPLCPSVSVQWRFWQRATAPSQS